MEAFHNIHVSLVIHILLLMIKTLKIHGEYKDYTDARDPLQDNDNIALNIMKLKTVSFPEEELDDKWTTDAEQHENESKKSVLSDLYFNDFLNKRNSLPHLRALYFARPAVGEHLNFGHRISRCQIIQSVQRFEENDFKYIPAIVHNFTCVPFSQEILSHNKHVCSSQTCDTHFENIFIFKKGINSDGWVPIKLRVGVGCKCITNMC